MDGSFMILFDTNSPALRYAASLISGVESEDEPVKVVIGDDAVLFTLKCGLKIKTPIWKGDYDVSDFADCNEFYFNARFLGKALNTCINSDQIAFMRQDDTVHVAGYLKKPDVPKEDVKKLEDGSDKEAAGTDIVVAEEEEAEPIFSYEAELVNVEPFDEAEFGESNATFVMEQSDMVELFSLSDYFTDVDICRKSGVVSFRVGNDDMSVVTRYNMSNVGNSKSDPNFAFNVSKSTMKLLSFIGTGSVTIDYDEKNSAITASDGSITVVAKVEPSKYETLVFKDGETKFITPGTAFDEAIPKLCENLAATNKDDELTFEYIGPLNVGITWKEKYGEIFKMVSVGEAKPFEPFAIKCRILHILLGSIHDSSVIFAETATGKQVALCSNKRYQRKVIF